MTPSPDSLTILAELVQDTKTTALSMIQGRDNYGEVITVDPANPDACNWHDIHAEAYGPQVIISMFLDLGPREVDTLAIVGFALPHDGNLTVVVNHVDGLSTSDNAEEMFG